MVSSDTCSRPAKVQPTIGRPPHLRWTATSTRLDVTLYPSLSPKPCIHEFERGLLAHFHERAMLDVEKVMVLPSWMKNVSPIWKLAVLPLSSLRVSSPISKVSITGEWKGGHVNCLNRPCSTIPTSSQVYLGAVDGSGPSSRKKDPVSP